MYRVTYHAIVKLLCLTHFYCTTVEPILIDYMGVGFGKILKTFMDQEKKILLITLQQSSNLIKPDSNPTKQDTFIICIIKPIPLKH